MGRPAAAAAVAAALLILNGALHGVWSHRWETWSESTVQAERIEKIPLRVGDNGEWEGKEDETEASALTLPEEVVGRGKTVLYVNRFNGSEVKVFLSCGPTEGLVAHTPQACYSAHGFVCPAQDLHVELPGSRGWKGEAWASTFSKTNAAVPLHLRVLWTWSDGTGGWRVPENPRRTFRRTPVLYKCYAIRQVTSPTEPLDGDPGVALLAALLPALDKVLFETP